jgi:hypothetical protein
MAEVRIAMLQVIIPAVHFMIMRRIAVKLATTTAFFSGDIFSVLKNSDSAIIYNFKLMPILLRI